MKKYNYIIIALFSVLFLVSCGGSKKSETVKVKPENSEISGDLSEYIQVVENEYELADDWGAKLSIKIKAIKQMEEADLLDKDVELTISLLGENGMPVSGTGELKIDYTTKDKLLSLLKSGKGEEVILFSSLLGDYHADEHGDKVKKFSVYSKLKVVEKTSSNTSNTVDNSKNNNKEEVKNEEKDEEVASKESNEDWDKILDSYEKFANDYIDYTKKIVALQKKGDNASITEMATLMPKALQLNQDATELGTKLQNASSDLTTAQMTRYTKIMTKFAQAALELSKM